MQHEFWRHVAMQQHSCAAEAQRRGKGRGIMVNRTLTAPREDGEGATACRFRGTMIVRQFLHWIETAPASRRAEAAGALARAYLASDVEPDVLDEMEAAMTVLLDDPCADVRLALAEVLAESDAAPRHVLLALVADNEPIAALVLSRSPLLFDAELVDIVAAAAEPLQVAVAARASVSASLAAAVAEVGCRESCLALLANSGAAIARISLRRIAERFGEEAELREALLARPGLPVEVRHLLMRRLGETLGSYVIGRSWLGQERALSVSRDVCDRATIAIAAESVSEERAALVEHLRVTGQLTTSLLLRAVCAGNARLFETALAVLAGVPEARVEALVRTGRPGALRALYRRAGLPERAFEAFAAALAAGRNAGAAGSGPAARYRASREMVEAVLERYDAISDGEMNELTTMLRRFAAEAARSAAKDFASACADAA
jgi:uncharacterized protein (DUF2336 family)